MKDFVKIFVYGSLMRGERANYMLKDGLYLGKYLLNGYGMYDLGAYPGIVKMEGESVVGELYEVPEYIVPQLDGYEVEGDLYIRTEVEVAKCTETVIAYAYVYNRPVTGRPCRKVWNIQPTDYVWYAAYGSNISSERFQCYIKGGLNPFNGNMNRGCNDKSLWIDSKMASYPGNVYFGNVSTSWGGCGVAFYDHMDTEQMCRAWFRLYKITWQQLLEIQGQECAADHWYGRRICLDVLEDNCPVFTFTSETKRPLNEPSMVYADLIRNSIIEQLGAGRDFEIDNYMAERSEGLNKIIRERLRRPTEGGTYNGI